ncbi:AAA family ATPase [Gordonia sp. (in: high G+C Gram-positive bacteria)]|uniref:MinD/ParA family ATP-binding protein n=1 Tax=Gordonia sp. (in: high G+C Gram-positive bacteria) TaxID=84139 RepID=UPI0039E3AA79
MTYSDGSQPPPWMTAQSERSGGDVTGQPKGAESTPPSPHQQPAPPAEDPADPRNDFDPSVEIQTDDEPAALNPFAGLQTDQPAATRTPTAPSQPAAPEQAVAPRPSSASTAPQPPAAPAPQPSPTPASPQAYPQQGHPPQHLQQQPGLLPQMPQVGQSALHHIAGGQAPRRRLRDMMRTAANGLISFGGTSNQKSINELVERVRQPVRTDFRVAVLSLKGGVGKTTVTVGLGSALSSLRGDRVIAIDANPDLGTLARRVPTQTHSTVRDLLRDPNITRYSDVRRHTSQAPSRLEVLASSSDPELSEAFSAEDYIRTVDILENHYNLILTDCGTGLVHSAMNGVLKLANSLVLVTSPAVDGAQSAMVTLDWLAAHGYGQLAQECIVVIAASRGKDTPVDVENLADWFRGRVRAVQIIPYDDHLAVGGHIDLDHMNPNTRAAYLELAAMLIDPFAVPAYPQQHIPPGAHHFSS